MNAYPGTLGKLNRIEIDSYLYLPPLNISIQSYIGRILFLFGRVIEYVFGIHLGGAIGYICGKWAGVLCLRYYSSMSHAALEVDNLWLLSNVFAIYSATIGAVIGVLLITAFIARENNYKRKKEEGGDATKQVENLDSCM